MAELGLCSRREADAWIEKGWVRVNGQVAPMGLQVTPDARIEVDPRARGQQQQQVTVLLHKPMGYVSGQAEDGHEPAVVLVQPRNQWKGDASKTRFAPGQLRGLAPAGRLDIDSVGLLVLTQDGRVARQLIGEDSGMEKEYLVRVVYTGVANPAAATSAAAGVLTPMPCVPVIPAPWSPGATATEVATWWTRQVARAAIAGRLHARLGACMAAGPGARVIEQAVAVGRCRRQREKARQCACAGATAPAPRRPPAAGAPRSSSARRR